MDLENKVSLVTGAGQGIGEGIAKILASHGSKVMIVDLNKQSAEKVTKEINTLFPNSAASFEAAALLQIQSNFVNEDKVA